MATSTEPLAQRMRPSKLSEYIGQEHLVGDGATLRKAIESGNLPSMILWGPPGTGKTTLAHIISKELDRPFFMLSAVHSGVKEVREVIESAEKEGLFTSAKPILFIDEIHRFSKSQQDSLLGAVERGSVTLLGATTENPSFEVISALLSRCLVYILKPLSEAQLIELLRLAFEKDDWVKKQNVVLAEKEALLNISGGDARRLFNNLEALLFNLGEVEHSKKTESITNENVVKILQQSTVRYDKTGDQHYDIISAFIKSIRGSDPNGAVYWLARMVEGGEQPEFIARRLLILASEDIGIANPTALVVANSCFEAVHVIGWPESRIILSHCAIYLAGSEKSNTAYLAIKKAQDEVRRSGNLSVPLHLRNAPTKLMKDEGYGKGYQYSHDYPENFKEQEYLPDELSGTAFYKPTLNSREQEIKKRLFDRWKDKYGYDK